MAEAVQLPSTVAVNPQMPRDEELEKFEFLEVMGKGAFGRVYMVSQQTTEFLLSF